MLKKSSKTAQPTCQPTYHQSSTVVDDWWRHLIQWCKQTSSLFVFL